MAGSLTAEQVAAYQRDGILFPIRVMSEADAAQAVRQLEALEARWDGKIPKRRNQKLHMLAPWLNEIVRSPAVLDAVESLIGPDIICWNGGFFTKGAGDGAFISWHQDSTYWGLSHPDVVTAWIAFTPSTPESGCMQVIPGTQTSDQVAHKDTFAAGNLLSRGQEIAVEVDKSQAVDVVLRPGGDEPAPCKDFSRLGGEPERGAADRLCDPLHSDLREAGERAADIGVPGARGGPVRAFRRRADTGLGPCAGGGGGV